MAAPDPPSKLTYIPLGYRHRRSRAVGFAILTGIAAVVIAAIHWRGGGLPWWGQAMIVGVPGALTVLAYSLHWGAECRVEGESLWFASENTPPVSISIDEIIAIDRIDAGENSWFEIVVRDKGRMKVARDVFEPIEPLRDALRAFNPGIRFGSHSGWCCRSCGGHLFEGEMPSIREMGRFMRNPKCPACDMRLPKFGQFVP